MKVKSQPRIGADRPPAHPTGFFAALNTRPWILAVVLALATVAVYLPVHRHPFLTIDDDPYVASNPHLQSDFGWETVTWAFTTYDLANWHPVTWLSHALDVRMFGLNPSGHHDVNLLLHAINALLLFWVLLRATGYCWRSFMVAALFALHPINVETVAWIAERKNPLSLLFFLLALGAYRWYAQKPRIGRYMVVALLYALGLMAKPQVITFPFVLLLWDYWPLRRMFHMGHRAKKLLADARQRSPAIATVAAVPAQKFSWLALEKLPLLALAVGSAIMTIRAHGQGGALRYYPLSVRLGNAVVSYVRYIGKALWPSRLAVFYPHSDLRAWQVAGSLLLLLVITGFAIQQRWQRYLAVGWFWYLGTLVPMIGIVQVGEQAMADRYAYLSFIGLFVMVCWGVSDWAEQPHLSPAWLAAPSAAVLLILAGMTYRQLNYWSDNVTLWSRMMAISSDSYYDAEENLGIALLESGQPESAMQHFQHVTALVPTSSGAMDRALAVSAAVAHLYLGANDQEHGKPSDAIAHYKAVLGLAQDFAAQNVYTDLPPMLAGLKATALENMGNAYEALRDFSDAKASFRAALQLDPRSAHRWLALGVVEQKSGDLAAAIQAYSRLTQLQPSDVAFLLLAQALEESGHPEEAQAAKQQAKFMTHNLAAAEQIINKLLTH